MPALRYKNRDGVAAMEIAHREEIVREIYLGGTLKSVTDKWKAIYPPIWIKLCLADVDCNRREVRALLGHYREGSREYNALKRHLENLPLSAMLSEDKSVLMSEEWINYEIRHNKCADTDAMDAIIIERGGMWI